MITKTTKKPTEARTKKPAKPIDKTPSQAWLDEGPWPLEPNEVQQVAASLDNDLGIIVGINVDTGEIRELTAWSGLPEKQFVEQGQVCDLSVDAEMQFIKLNQDGEQWIVFYLPVKFRTNALQIVQKASEWIRSQWLTLQICKETEAKTGKQ